MVRFLYLILLSLASLSLCAQTAAVSAGGSSVTSAGFISVSVGQPACHYASSSAHYDGQGVQQPYPQSQPQPQPHTHRDTLYASVCQGVPYVSGAFNLPADSTATPGPHTFTRHYTAADGGDSLVTLLLTVNANTTGTDVRTACDSFTWIDGNTYTSSSNNSQITLPNSHGCDSTVTLHLTIHHATVSYETQQVDAQYQWHGRTLTASGVYRDTLRGANAMGCDSVVQLSLAVIGNFPVPVIYCYSRRLIMVDHYPGGEGTPRVDYYAYRWYRDGELLPLATADNYFILLHEQYIPLEGCYQVEVPLDAARTFWVRSNVLCLTDDGDALRSPTLVLYPNPSPARGTVTALVADSHPGSQLLLHDAHGRLLHSVEAADGRNAIPLNLTAGTYTVTLRGPQGEPVIRKLVVR